MTVQTTGQRPHLNPRPGGPASPLLSRWQREGAEGALAVDPITAEIVRSALVAITDEMKTNLMRTAYNMIIYEALDFTV
ncbi:MAG TPA: hydantoinase B/oxoprolinase family protein, partial [Chloroflexota bacterium]|nr:hydantoinase B/oxoprolinase family protein [Chloroflexota bacterium]